MSNQFAAPLSLSPVGKICMYLRIPDFYHSPFSYCASVFGKELGRDIRFFFDTRIESCPCRRCSSFLSPAIYSFLLSFSKNKCPTGDASPANFKNPSRESVVPASFCGMKLVPEGYITSPNLKSSIQNLQPFFPALCSLFSALLTKIPPFLEASVTDPRLNKPF